VDDILRYLRSSQETGIKKGEYTRVVGVDAQKNLVTVVRADGSEQTYDPRRQMGVIAYRAQEREFSVGDRIPSRLMTTGRSSEQSAKLGPSWKS
jgi:hypothetical protein